MDVGRRFQFLRKKAGYETADGFAAHAKLSRSFVSSFENNQSSPTIRTILKLIKHLPCTLAEFFAEETSLPPEFSSKGKPVQITEDDLEWFVMLKAILASDDYAAISAIKSSLLCFDEKVRERIELLKLSPQKTDPLKQLLVKGPRLSGPKKRHSVGKIFTAG